MKRRKRYHFWILGAAFCCLLRWGFPWMQENRVCEEVFGGQAGAYVHTHAEICYSGYGNLRCDLRRITQHTDSADGCPAADPQLCSMEELPAHTHGEECFAHQEEMMEPDKRLGTVKISRFTGAGMLQMAAACFLLGIQNRFPAGWLSVRLRR